MFRPIRRWDTVRNEDGDAESIVEISPDAFRMCLCLYLICFFALATFITRQFAATDFEDNPVLHRFGSNSICVMLDDPPFSLFGWTLWFPATILALAFEFFDYIRVYQHYYGGHDQYPITKAFFVYHNISTVFECIFIVTFAQIFATSPTESIYMHTWPYLLLMFTLWLIEVKRFLYLWKVGALPTYAIIWVMICAMSTICRYCDSIANLYGARLWETYPWTSSVRKVNVPLWLFLVIIGPVAIYGMLWDHVDTVIVNLNRSRHDNEEQRSHVSRCKMLLHLVRRWRSVRKDSGDIETHCEVHPEAFRMCFYLYFLMFFAVASFVTLMWSAIDLNDNLMVDRFGYSTFSVIFSYPPFSLFASTLWFPAVVLLLFFEIFDFISVYDHLLDDDAQRPIGKLFFVYYSISTLVECLGVICFGQIFATSPTEHIYVHSWTYILFVVSFWLMMLKQFLYFRRIQVVLRYGVIYIILCSVSAGITIFLYLSNLYGAKLWESSPWTATLQQTNDVLYNVLLVVAPMAIYGVIGKDMNSVDVILSRSDGKEKKAPEPEQEPFL